MSSSRRQFLALLGGGLLVGGCGFKPMLADTNRSADPFWGSRAPRSVSQAMRTIYVHTPGYNGEDGARLARAFRNEMINRVGQPAQPLYSLKTDVQISLGSSGISQDSSITRYRAVGSVSAQLLQLDTQGNKSPKSLLSESVRGWSGYDVVDSPYADLISERDAIDRVAIMLSDRLYNRIGSYFAQPRGQIFSPL